MQTTHQPLDVEIYLPYMRDVDRCQRSLHELAMAWRLIEATARMTGATNAAVILPTIGAARQNFDDLEVKLIQNLVEEKIAGILREVSTKALYIIDILVRNLYERTADVAFLATDHELCAFMADALPTTGFCAPASKSNSTTGAACNANYAYAEPFDAVGATHRLDSYRRKYSVYSAVVLLKPDGSVIAVSSEHILPRQCSEPFLHEALARDGYVEVYGPSTLQPKAVRSLLYAHRMLEPGTDRPVGVLCLIFDLEGETQRIFESHRDPQARYNMMLLDHTDHCIASADPQWVWPGTRVAVNPQGGRQLQMHAGRLYFIATHAATGYQGYPGPAGWRGQVMIPLEIAFSASASDNHVLPSGLLEHVGEFCPPLREVINAAETIRRVVWNGQVISAGAATSSGSWLPAVLGQISETGARSDALFQASIYGLYETVVATRLQDAEFVARLVVDLLDRNLYERANDCRWWALTEELRHALESPSSASAAAAQSVLEQINKLYTVYTSIYIYDESGAVLARSSRDGASLDLERVSIDPSTVRAVRSLTSEQGYFVEGFAPAPTYRGRATYVYHAAIRATDARVGALGGIGLVFDAGVELVAMLEAALAGDAVSHVCILDRKGMVMAASGSSRFKPGSRFPTDDGMLTLPPGGSQTRVVEIEGEYAIVACSVSCGYREFKRSDGYCDDVIAVVYQMLGTVPAYTAPPAAISVYESDKATSGDEQYAVFSCAGRLYAVAGACVVEARAAAALLPITVGGGPGCAGMLAMSTENGRALAWVYGLGSLLQGASPGVVVTAKEIVVLEMGAERIGLLVDTLHSVARHETRPLTLPGDSENRLIHAVIHVSDELMIPVISVPAIFRRLAGVMTSTQ